ncbi:hypothetical protein [Candidatus Albibeggiatoa sp. nov. NOAA]|uniref:hypothetical protein n=1 Tax=Candidatus Albibeggiatoa sp. nov. NOAA TaxID=3162724 RepID=UPI0032F769B8|nr:hypothetical protein [Thiotrichaceae bacterium]
MLNIKKKLLPSVMAAALATGVAFSGSASAIHLAEDGIGQSLLGPIYLANGVYSTKVAVVNTRNDVAVKAKVVLRSSVNSDELLDFICYLSPSDVCRFEIRQEGDKVYLYSDDDSILSPVAQGDDSVNKVDSLAKASATFASISPLTQELYDWRLTGTNDTTTMGHIEVFGVYGAKGNVVGYDSIGSEVTVQVKEGMSKFDLARIFDTPRYDYHYDSLFHRQITSANSLSLSDVVSNAPVEKTERNSGVDAPWGTLVSSKIRSTDPSWVALTGSVSIENNVDRIGYRIPALAGEAGDEVDAPYVVPTTLSDVAGTAAWDGFVVSNPEFDVTIGKETLLGSQFGISSTGVVNLSKIVEIETALATANFQATYEDNSNSTPAGTDRTQLIVTFPTRYLHDDDYDPGKTVFPKDPCGTPGLLAADTHSAPFQADGLALYSMIAYDNQEHYTETVDGLIFSGVQLCPDGSVPRSQTETTVRRDTRADNDCDTRGGLVEVNYFFPAWPASTDRYNFESGWFNLALEPRAGCPYNGMPAISYTHKYVIGENSPIKSWLTPVGHKK